jgi:hypothetical protein
VDIGAPLVAEGKAAEAVEPGQRALDPPSVPAQPFADPHAPPGNAGLEGAGSAFGSTTAVVVGFVGVKRAGPLPGATPAMTDTGIEGRPEHEAVMAMGWAQTHPERGAPAVDPNMASQARFATIRRVRAGLGAPSFAGPDALSRLARLQSRRSASAKRSRSTRGSPAQTPARCPSRSLRQQVMPEPPNARGGISQGMPEREPRT